MQCGGCDVFSGGVELCVCHVSPSLPWPIVGPLRDEDEVAIDGHSHSHLVVIRIEDQ
jgi:hypothetical protein